MRNFDQVAQHVRDQLLESLYESLEGEEVSVHLITIKPKEFSIQFIDEYGEKVKYDFPRRKLK